MFTFFNYNVGKCPINNSIIINYFYTMANNFIIGGVIRDYNAKRQSWDSQEPILVVI